MKAINLTILLLVLSALALAACGPKTFTTASGDVIPAQYGNMKNPLAGQQDAVTAGKDLFTTNCVPCHGTDAKGGGPAGASLDPKPADLTDPAANDPDGQIFYRIAEGPTGGPKGSAMPAWKGTLTDTQIWQVITYLRSLGEK